MDQSLHDQLLALFFTYFNDWCCWVNPSLFFRDMVLCLSSQGNTQSRTSYYSPLLHNAVLSMGANFCEDPRLGIRDRGRPFAMKAIEAITIEGERPMLSTVSGLMLLGSYHSGNAKQSLGYLYAGMGLRMCQTLGLGIDCSSSNLISASLKRERDRTFYMAYIQDKLWGAYVGRSASMILSDHETPLPTVDKQRDEAPWLPFDQSLNDTPGHDSSATPAATPVPVSSWASTNFLWTCNLAALSERVTETLYSLHANIFSSRTQDAVSTLNLQLGEWYSNLPAELAISPYSTKIPPPHVIMLHAMYHFVVILLHRPFYSRNRSPRQSALHDLSVSRCDTAAAKIVHLIELYRRVPGLRYGTISLTQITFTAGTIHLLGAVSHENSRSEKRFRTALAGARECVRALEEMGRAWQCATQSGQVLDNLIRDWCPQGTRFEGEARSAGEVVLETGTQTPMNVNLQQTLQNPSSDLAKELLRLGWTPPTQVPTTQPKTASIPTTLTSQELPPSTFSTLDQLSVLRENGVQQQYKDTDPELLWDTNIDSQQQLFGTSGNFFGLENSFGWGYVSNWEYGQGAFPSGSYPQHGQGSNPF
ncbi:fungal specific transcription [Moniliophthora roreri MCA 2997]|uniref:Fungal specific transcription n=2 Tax=Moniliophthora roreri TaxID=221103 RepID=V2WXL1_MONRO|nr:fungal specific transcription [Moniliophthora roreri MCA 2997]